MSFYKEVPGRKTTLESTLKFDTTPTAGSTNPVTSDGVASAITEAVGGASDALQEQIDDIAEKAGSGYTPKGPASVATLNALSGQENGELYTMTDAGTLTDGSLAVVAGDTVAWDATNEVWYKAMDYAPRQYGTNEVHNLPTTITDFRTGDVIPVDGPDGTAKMSKDDLLAVTAQNAVEKGVVETDTISLTGISEIGNVGTMVISEFSAPNGAEVIITLPNTIWDTSNISASQGYCFACGYINNGTRVDYVLYGTNDVHFHGGQQIVLPSGYTKYYVGMRGNTGEVATFSIVQKYSVLEYVKKVGQDYSAVQYYLSDNVSKSTTLASSDFPTDMKKKFSHGMELDPIIKNPGGANWGQGFAISDEGFVINFITGTSQARPCVGSLFDKAVKYNRTVSTSGYMTGNPHCNFAFWGTEKYDAGDKYPLLYVGGHLGTSDFSVAANILVMRIVGDLADSENVSFSIVQVITFPASIGQVTDAQIIGGNLYAIYGNKFTKFSALPQLSQGNVTFTDADILDSFTLSDVWTPSPIQCGCVVDGIYYSVHGSGTTGVLAIMDVANRAGKVGMMPKFGEYEAIFYYMNNFYITNKITNTYGLAQALIVSKLTMTFDE